MTWSPERIAAVERMLDEAPKTASEMDDPYTFTARQALDRDALARIGLATVKAELEAKAELHRERLQAQGPFARPDAQVNTWPQRIEEAPTFSATLTFANANKTFLTISPQGEITLGPDATADDVVRSLISLASADLQRNAAIGLAVIKAEPETVERVARALATLSSPSYSEDRNWEDDLPLLRRRAKRGIRSVLDNPIGSAAAALAALKEATTPPAPPAGLPDPRG